VEREGWREMTSWIAPTHGCVSICALRFPLLAQMNLFAINADRGRSGDADAHLRAVHCQDYDLNVLPDDNGFAGASSEYQHAASRV
jgi:hypothetical protein